MIVERDIVERNIVVGRIIINIHKEPRGLSHYMVHLVSVCYKESIFRHPLSYNLINLI